jgi:phosphomannomutase
MSDAPLMLGVSGLRGIVGQSLTPEVAMRFAGAFGAWLRGRGGGATVVVAMDGRSGGAEVMSWAVDGLCASGVTVLDAGVCMTPTVGVLVDALDADGAVIITASHNPQEWNGLKLLRRVADRSIPPGGPRVADAAAPTPRQADEIIGMYAQGQTPMPTARPLATPASRRVGDPERHHVSALHRAMAACGLGSGPARVVVDSVNSSGVKSAQKLPHELGVTLARHLGGDSSGIFPHPPEPTAENLAGGGGLCDAVPGLKADIGFAQDPDGDRLAIVDENGRYIGEEYTLALCAASILEARASSEGRSRGREHADLDDVVLCANLSTSRMIDDVAARYGARVVRTAVGEANVVEAMKRLKKEGKAVVLGGEGNGGVIWPEVTYVRDSLSAMALVLSLMARTGKPVSRLVADIPAYAIVKRKQPLANKADAGPALARIAARYTAERVDTQDGVRVDFDRLRAWVHVRASNTEPILRLIAEAGDEATAHRVLDEAAAIVRG